MDEFLNALSNQGFSIVVACYVLFRLEKKIDELTKSITQLTVNVTSFCSLKKDN